MNDNLQGWIIFLVLIISVGFFIIFAVIPFYQEQKVLMNCLKPYAIEYCESNILTYIYNDENVFICENISARENSIMRLRFLDNELKECKK